VGTITVITSGAPPSGPSTLYYFSLAVVRGPLQEREVLDSVESSACRGLTDLIDMARKQGDELKQRLNDPAFQTKLETD
jgi:hypothetical protein